MSCSEEHCITCSDEAIPMVVVRAMQQGQASCCDEAGAEHLVAIDLVEPIVPGEELLVHAGVAIGRRA